MLVLGIETSCDETAAAVVRDGREILSSVVASQAEVHLPFGGVVPELASRQHLRLIEPVVCQALDQAGLTIAEVQAVAATRGPGLAVSLLIGLSAGKAIAAARDIPFIGANHLEAHLVSPFLSSGQPPVFPCVSLIVSGGHTLLVHVRDIGRYDVLGGTVDDAAGEAFDKVAKLLGLGYPGGPAIDRLAATGHPEAVAFPRGMLHSGDYQFSFSGLKTAVLYHVRNRAGPGPNTPAGLADICASFQEAVVDVLVDKTLRAARARNVDVVGVSGGVSCNRRLREKLGAACRDKGITARLADPSLCTDNAAMIAAIADAHLARGRADPLDLDIDPNLGLGGGAA